jgi:hypothetical protein
MAIGGGWGVAGALAVGDAGIASQVVVLSDLAAGGSDVLLALSPAPGPSSGRRGTRSTPDRDDETVDRSSRSRVRERSSKLRYRA